MRRWTIPAPVDIPGLCLDYPRRHSHLGGISPEVFERASSRGWEMSTGAGVVHVSRRPRIGFNRQQSNKRMARMLKLLAYRAR